MHTAMSTKRTFVSSRRRTGTRNAGSVAFWAAAGGLLLMALGIYTGLTLLAVAGFLPFTIALLYFNANFWAEMYDSGKLHQSHIRRNFPHFD